MISGVGTSVGEEVWVRGEGRPARLEFASSDGTQIDTDILDCILDVVVVL